MGVVEQSRAAVEEQLSALEERYSQFSVNQTTFSVSTARYERERNTLDAGQIDVYTKVRNETGNVLHRNETPELPATQVTDIDTIETAAQQSVEETVGVECTVTGLEEATILGIHDAGNADRETIYSLAVVFTATHETGTPDETALWQSEVSLSLSSSPSL